MKKEFLLFLLFAIVNVAMAQYGTDNAQETAYNDGWTTGDNGGYGFSAWNLTTGVDGNIFIATGADCNILIGGEAWGLWANNDYTTEAVRPFTQALNVGDILSLQMENNGIYGSSSTGFSLRNSDNQILFEFYYQAGSTNTYKVSDFNGESAVDEALGWTNAGLNIQILLTASNTYTLTVSRIGETIVYTKTGTLKTPATGTQTINNFRFFYYEQNGQSSDNVYFNNLRVYKAPQGNALDFDGADDYVNVAGGGGLNNLETGTIEMWVKWNGTQDAGHSGFGHILSRQKDFGFSNQVIGLSTNNPATAKITWLPYAVGNVVTGNTTIGNNEWVHIAISYQSGDHKIYVNGLLDATSTLTGDIGDDITQMLSIGSWSDGGAGYAKAQIDEIRIWNTIRSQSDIQNYMYSYLVGNESGLKAYYRFDQGNAGNDNTAFTEVIDYSGNCNKGTLTNFARTGATSNWIDPGNTEAPILTTNAANSVTLTSAALSGNVFSLGETTLTARGFQYSTSSCMASPTTIDNTASTTGTYTANVNGLTPNTLYYYRAYATNSKGTTYGETQSFVTFIPLGNALSFDGSNDYVSTGNISISGVQPRTLEFWYKKGAISSTYSHIANWGTHAINQGFGFYIMNNTNLYFYANSTDFYTGYNLDNNWHHIAVSYNGTSVNVYVDGNETPITNVARTLATTETPLILGTSPNLSSTKYNDGTIDEVRIWNSARTQAEIQASMYSYYTGSMTNLKAYYRFDQGNAGNDNTAFTEVIDYSGNCNKGTLTNFTRTGATSNWVHPGNAEAPIVTTHVVNYASFASAQLAGKIISFGETNSNQRGFQYATNACFSSGLNSVSETGTFNTNGEIFTATIYGLSPATTYYYRSFATNSKGTSYGETRSFVTESILPPGSCLNVDGTDDYVNLTDINLDADFTLEAWINIDNYSSGYRPIISKQTVDPSNNVNHEFDFQIQQTTGNLSFFMGNGSGYGILMDGKNNAADADVTIGKWHHVAVTMEGTTCKMYLDGILTDQDVFSGSRQIGSLPVQISKYNNGVSQYFDGKIDEVRIWNDARTQDEIILYMNRTIENPNVEANLMAYYNFDENTGTTANDETVNNNDGALQNGTTWANSDAFNVWTGVTDNVWATSSNWSDGLPDATDNLCIYPAANIPAVAGNLTLNNLVIAQNTSFTQTANNLLTINGNLFSLGTLNIAASSGANPGMVTVNGALYVGTGGTLNLLSPISENPSGSLITNGTVLGTGTVKIDRFFTVRQSWQQLGVPLDNQSTALFTENHHTNEYNPNLLAFSEPFDFTTDPANTNSTNWSAQTGYWQKAQPTAGWGNGVPMNTGTGYFYYSTTNPVIHYSSVVTDLNNENKLVNVSYTNNDNANGVGSNYDGWNLLSNPFASAIDWTLLSKSAHCEATVYFYNSQTGNYKYYGSLQSWGTSETSPYIAPMQAFWVHLSSTSDVNESFTFNKSARVHNAQSMYKSSKKAEFEFITLQAANNNQTDELMIGYFDDASLEFDTKYDAYKRFAGNSIPMIYSINEQPEIALALNALPLEHKGNKIKLGYQSTVSGTHTIRLKETNTTIPIVLVDLLENKQIDLNQSDYTFEFKAGETNNRFELFTNTTTTLDSDVFENDVLVYPNPTHDKVYLRASNNNIQKVTLTDITGKLIFSTNNIQQHETIDLSGYRSGIYFISIQTDNKVFTTKIVKE